MENLLNNYSQWLEVNGASLNTRLTYVEKVNKFLTFSNQIVTKETIEAFILELSKTTKATTINLYRNAISSLLKFQGLNITLPKSRKIDTVEVDAIDVDFVYSKVLPLVDSEFQNKDKVKAIICFFLSTGIRRSEIDNIKRSDFDLEKRRVQVYQTKNKNHKTYLLDKTTAEYVSYYFQIESEDINAFNIKSTGVKAIFYKLAQHFPDIRFRSHLMRHSLATHMYKSTGDIKLVKDILGHADIKSTEKYTRTTVDEIQKRYDTVMNKSYDKLVKKAKKK